jgi:glycosyltransferase involved in cell wall biosynthesis
MITVITFGPGPIFKGGIANYNTSLAKALVRRGDVKVHIVSWTQQYPAIIPRDFIDRKSKKDLLQDTAAEVYYITNYNNPFTWYKTVRLIISLNPDIVIFQWAIAIQGLPLGWIARRLVRTSSCEVLFDLHFVKQKEGSGLDTMLTRYGISAAHSYVVHAERTAAELSALFPGRKFRVTEVRQEKKGSGSQVIRLFHPVYDMFAPDPQFDVQHQKTSLGLKKHVFLFFGFIRKYKGLHHVIRAFAGVARQRDDVSLLIVGESFWQTLDSRKPVTRIKNMLFGFFKKLLLRKADDERNYRPLDLIEELSISGQVCLVNEFVPNEDVNKYFQVSDYIMLFYETATPSGVESLAYNFKLPILATRVGHFPDTVRDGYNGYLAEPGNIESMTVVMMKALNQPIPREHVAETSAQKSWDNYAAAIIGENDP